MRKSYDNINNKFPIKDITPDDISNKIKLVSNKKEKKIKDQKPRFFK